MENKDSKVLLWFKKNLTVKAITANAFIAALYAVITIYVLLYLIRSRNLDLVKP